MGEIVSTVKDTAKWLQEGVAKEMGLAVYTHMNPRPADAMGCILPALFVEATFRTGVERSDLSWQTGIPADLTIWYMASMHRDNYQEACETRDEILDKLLDACRAKNYKPSITYLGSVTDGDPRGWRVASAICLGDI
jgi:hypothetical protein